MKKWWFFLPLAILALAAILLAVAFVVDFDSPRLGQALLDHVARRTGMEVEAQSFHLNLLQGLKLGEVKARAQLPSGSLSVALDQLVLEHRLAPLLHGEVRVEEVLLERPRVILEAQGLAAGASPRTPSRPPEPPPGDAEASPQTVGGLSVGVTLVRVEDGSVRYQPPDEEAGATEIKGLDLTLTHIALDSAAPSVLQGLAGDGEIRAEEVRTGETRLTDAHGKASFRDGHFIVAELDFSTPEGKFVLSDLDVDLNRDPFTYRMAFGGDLDLGAMLGASQGDSFGAATLSFRAQGLGAETSALTGDGTLEVDTGTFPDTPLFAAVDRAMGRAVLVGHRYTIFRAPFTVSDNRITADPFEIGTEEASLTLSGWVDLEGNLSLHAELHVPRQGLAIAEIPDEVLDVLSDEEGRVTVPLRIYGSRDAPRVRADSKSLRDQARRGAERELKQSLEAEVKKQLGKLFGKRD